MQQSCSSKNIRYKTKTQTSTILLHKCFYFWFFKYILLTIITYFSLSKVLNAPLVVVEYFQWGTRAFTSIKDLNTSSITEVMKRTINSISYTLYVWLNELHASRICLWFTNKQADIRNDALVTSHIICEITDTVQPWVTPCCTLSLTLSLSLAVCAQEHMYLWCLRVAGSLYLSLDCPRVRKCKG